MIKWLLGIDKLEKRIDALLSASAGASRDVMAITNKLGISPEGLSKLLADISDDDINEWLYKRIMADIDMGLGKSTNPEQEAILNLARERVNYAYNTKKIGETLESLERMNKELKNE